MILCSTQLDFYLIPRFITVCLLATFVAPGRQAASLLGIVTYLVTWFVLLSTTSFPLTLFPFTFTCRLQFLQFGYVTSLTEAGFTQYFCIISFFLHWPTRSILARPFNTSSHLRYFAVFS
ncbi:hypothetical protein DFH08DRAFT_439453 [Mycena albidolilacea]|uniref:Uncharacterized protein n=1 Tax=Mycena albidolilacea TaxID=1033008 RepID=A0AAD7AGF3_9AGAR|nr:hypothetical protein DFH08DRAFT_439453 [Mycena albidolilacea]